LLLGCSSNITNEGNYSKYDTVYIDTNKLSIPFTQLVYSKNSSNFNWQSGNSEEILPEIMEKYKELAIIAPGGWMVKETPTEYYICLSIGGVEAVTEGFEISTINIPSDGLVTEPLLSITAKRVSNEISGISAMNETVYVTSLITILKEDLPDNISIGAISLLLEEIL